MTRAEYNQYRNEDFCWYGLMILAVLGFAMFMNWVNGKPLLNYKTPAPPGVHKADPMPFPRLSEQSVIASGTERYWAEFSKILAVPTELTTSADAAWLDRIVARGRADIANIRKLDVLTVDNELLVASGEWTAASERMLAWLVRNKELLITLNQGRDLSDAAAAAESAEQVFALCASLPAEGLPPEMAEFRTVFHDVDVASGRLEELRIRLSERYKGHKFDWPAE